MVNLGKCIAEKEKELLCLQEGCMNYLNKAPKADIRVAGGRRKKQFYQVVKSENCKRIEKYISIKNEKLLQKLNQKKYIQNVNAFVEKQLESVQNLKQNYEESDIAQVYDRMPENSKRYIEPIIISDEEYARRWEERTEGGKNPYPITDDLYTEKGEHVRSRIEMNIADRLNHLEIPYRYESAFVLKDGREVYPDFIILNKRTRKEYYWEHLGKLGDQEYVEKNVRKMMDYERNGIFLGQNLIISIESTDGNVNMKAIDDQIRYFLC